MRLGWGGRFPFTDLKWMARGGFRWEGVWLFLGIFFLLPPWIQHSNQNDAIFQPPQKLIPLPLFCLGAAGRGGGVGRDGREGAAKVHTMEMADRMARADGTHSGTYNGIPIEARRLPPSLVADRFSAIFLPKFPPFQLEFVLIFKKYLKFLGFIFHDFFSAPVLF